MAKQENEKSSMMSHFGGDLNGQNREYDHHQASAGWHGTRKGQRSTRIKARWEEDANEMPYKVDVDGVVCQISTDSLVVEVEAWRKDWQMSREIAPSVSSKTVIKLSTVSIDCL